MKLALAQISSKVGDILFNKKKVIEYLVKAHKQEVELLLFPEMALTSYPLLDLVFDPRVLKENLEAIKELHKKIPKNMTVLMGCLDVKKGKPGNAIVALSKNKPIKFFSKEHLADYQVFDEKRYFKAGSLKDNIFHFKDLKIQLLICEEIWQKPIGAKNKKPDLIISFNASPFEQNKQAKRLKQAQAWTQKYQVPLIYLNSVGGQEELIFDGSSFILNNKGEILKQAPRFKEDLISFSLESKKKSKIIKKNKLEETSEALVFGLKEFLSRNGFTSCHLGLSGGVDSAVVASLALKALGAKNVKLFFLPGPFTSALSKKYARQQAQKLGCPLTVHSVNDTYLEILKKLKKPSALARQNLLARLRSLFLMSYANSNPKSLLLACGNKSELAVGYSTLYGDLAGGLLPIGDLFKTEVYELASYLKVIPSIIKRAPTAELAENQLDENELAPYKKLDPVLIKLIEKKQQAQSPFEKRILKKILGSEFKRRQAPPILKIKDRGFDRGWRLPLSLSSLIK